MIARLKCYLGFHHFNKWIPGRFHYRDVEARSCVRCGAIQARFADEQPAGREVRA